MARNPIPYPRWIAAQRSSASPRPSHGSPFENPAAELDEGRLPPGKAPAPAAPVMRCTEQNGPCATQFYATLSAASPGPFDDVASLKSAIVAHRTIAACRPICARPTVLRVALAGHRYHGFGRSSTPRSSDVSVDVSPACAAVELSREIQDVCHRRAAGTHNRLRVVSDDRAARVRRVHLRAGCCLRPVGVLYSADQDVA